MDLEFTELNEYEYREFESWISINNEELYKNKISYEVKWIDKTYLVRLCDESMYTISDIMLDINNDLGYNAPS